MLRVLFRLCDKSDRSSYHFDPEFYSNSKVPIVEPMCPGLMMVLTRFCINYYIKNPNESNEILVSGTALTETKLLDTLYFRFIYDEIHKILFLESYNVIPEEYQNIPTIDMPKRDKLHMMYLAVNPMEDKVIIYSTFVGGIDYDSHVLSIFNFESEEGERDYAKEIH